MTQVIADMSSLKRDCIEDGSPTTPVEAQEEEMKESDHEVSHSDAGSHSLSVIPPPPPYQQQDTNENRVQRIKFHDYFPNSTDAQDPSVEIHQTGWQASTPRKTKDDVRIEHQLKLFFSYVTKYGQDGPKDVYMSAPIALVTVSAQRMMEEKRTPQLTFTSRRHSAQRHFSYQSIPPGQSLNLSLYKHPLLERDALHLMSYQLLSGTASNLRPKDHVFPLIQFFF